MSIAINIVLLRAPNAKLGKNCISICELSLYISWFLYWNCAAYEHGICILLCWLYFRTIRKQLCWTAWEDVEESHNKIHSFRFQKNCWSMRTRYAGISVASAENRQQSMPVLSRFIRNRERHLNARAQIRLLLLCREPTLAANSERHHQNVVPAIVRITHYHLISLQSQVATRGVWRL